MRVVNVLVRDNLGPAKLSSRSRLIDSGASAASRRGSALPGKKMSGLDQCFRMDKCSAADHREGDNTLQSKMRASQTREARIVFRSKSARHTDSKFASRRIGQPPG